MSYEPPKCEYLCSTQTIPAIERHWRWSGWGVWERLVCESCSRMSRSGDRGHQALYPGTKFRYEPLIVPKKDPEVDTFIEIVLITLMSYWRQP